MITWNINYFWKDEKLCDEEFYKSSLYLIDYINLAFINENIKIDRDYINYLLEFIFSILDIIKIFM